MSDAIKALDKLCECAYGNTTLQASSIMGFFDEIHAALTPAQAETGVNDINVVDISESGLLPCPFCGSEAKPFHYQKTAKQYVVCSGCSAEVTKDIWNTRTTPPRTELDRVMEALTQFVYETTHLSRCEEDGSHRCKISAKTLDDARKARAILEQHGRC